MKRLMQINILWLILLLSCSSVIGYAQSANTLRSFDVKNGDTLILVNLEEIIVFPPLKFKNKRHKKYYGKLVRDVKKTLPYAKKASRLIQAVNDSLQHISSEKARKKYLKGVEKDLFNEFEQPLRKLTFSQGRLLLKLIDRECDQTSFEIVQLYRGKFSAFLWQTVARIFGANLKSEYDGFRDDFMIERVVILVEKGQI